MSLACVFTGTAGCHVLYSTDQCAYTFTGTALTALSLDCSDCVQ